MPPVDLLPARPFTAHEACAVGVPKSRLRQLLLSREVRVVLHGVYVRAELADTPELRARAAALVVRPDTVMSDRSAAWLHGVDAFSYQEVELGAPVECVVLPESRRVGRRGCRGGQRDLRESDVMDGGGLRVTTPLRTALDLGCALSRPRALGTLDMFARLHGVTPDLLATELPRYQGRRGVVQLRSLVPLVDARAESTGESWTRLAVVDAGLPAPTPQHWVVHHGVPIFRLDLAYPASRVAIEYDGVEFHQRTPEQRAADERRRRWLTNHGWTVIVVDKDSFTPFNLDAWLERLQEALSVPPRMR